MMMLLCLYFVSLCEMCMCKVKDWSKVDYDALDKEWEKGDEATDLLSEEEIEKYTQAQQQHSSLDDPQLFHVTLKEKVKALEMSKLVSIWEELLFTNHITIKSYQIDEATIMITLQHGTHAEVVKTFLLEQKEIEKIAWDKKEYFPSKKEL